MTGKMTGKIIAGEDIKAGSLCFLKSGKLYKCKRSEDREIERQDIRSFELWLEDFKNICVNDGYHIEYITSFLSEYIDYCLRKRGVK
jgi:hypothetical protein